ncbi:hypothetical protein APHAL10511_006278 [Amanita phalloides]|nr:hypothetical protein APHAL10511_006278 [Amanita phalloides]
MAKKKKTQLKPVARGFAVTSVPKKIIQADEDSNETSTIPGGSQNEEAISPAPGSSSNAEVDPDKLEERVLQNLVDTFQEKTEKEILRNIKAIEQDRRFSKTLPRLWMDPFFTDQIIALAQETLFEGKTPLEEPEDKAIGKLAITYGVLRRLGFSEARVDECLKSINGIDLEDAYDWLYINCTAVEFEEIQDGLVIKSTTPSSHISHFHLSDLPGSGISTPTTPMDAAYRSTSSTPHRIASPTPPAIDDERTSLRLLVSDAIQDGIDEIDTDEPTQAYVRLKLLLDRFNGHRRADPSIDIARIAELRRRLAIVKSDYLFDENEAKARYIEECKKVEVMALRERLKGAISLETEVPRIEQRAPSQVTTPEEPKPKSTDIFDGDDELSEGLLNILHVPSTETTPEGTTITIKDMALPKHWSGRMPKTLLLEMVLMKDRYAAVSYNIISGDSRAKRASVNLRWDGQRTETFTMSDVACQEEGQAEQYIATIALHALSFPASNGFSGSSQSSPAFFRFLPTVYRDLWDELEVSRKEAENSRNRALWAKLRSIIELKLDSESKVVGRVTKQAVAVEDRHSMRPPAPKPDSPEKLIEIIRERQASSNYQRMLAQRNQLPIARYRSQILDVLELSQVLVLSGETGCGKSTQVPAFVLEDQLSRGRHCKIYCTEPRRISAISLAQRVSQELGEGPSSVGTSGSLVGYSIRLESNTSRTTRLTFVTNGIALRMLESGTGPGGQGTAFDEITHIIIDEVHERTIESDFLLIVLKSLLSQRSDLKVILMSATVDAEKISAYFGDCPTLYIPGRTFPVDVRYLEDAVQFTSWNIAENSPYARRLHDKFFKGKNRPEWSEDLTAPDDYEDQNSSEVSLNLGKRYSPQTTMAINLLDERLIPHDLILRLIEKICFEDAAYTSYSSAILVFMPGLAEIRRLIDILSEHPLLGKEDEFRIYPLHSTLSSESQSAVFEVPPPGVRKIVISTNVAETGITIPDITCVIDTGKHREMRFDEKRQISRLVETFIAKSNATQRRGRAGRVQRGLCFHLFTKFRHDAQLADNPLPEMLRLSLSDLALRIKIMKVKLGTSIEDVLSKALDPPAPINVQRAVSVLVEVRALTATEDITPMGRLLSKLPTDVHLGKFLLIATLFRCLDPALTIAATLSSKSPFVSPLGLEQEADRAKNAFKIENCDFLTIHNAFTSWRRASSISSSHMKKFCRANYLSHQNLQQIEEMRQQFLGYLVDSSFILVDRGFIRDLSYSRYGRHRTRFVNVPSEYDINSTNTTLLHAALVAGLYPKLLSVDPSTGLLRTATNNQTVAFHPSSVNFGKKLTDMGTNYLVYFTLMHSKKLYAWETGPVDDISVALLCGESDFKVISDTLMIDRKIRFQVAPRTNIALKLLRTQLSSLVSHQIRTKILTESQTRWNDLAMLVLGKTKEVRDMSVVIR